MQLKPGTQLQGGKYEILETLGQGGFGITYLAEQVALCRMVAIKEFFMKEYCDRDEATSQVMLGTTASNRNLVAKFREKFLREAQMIGGLDHPNVVKIYDVFEENGTAYFAMEYIAGGSLKELVAEKGALSEKQALKYIREAGEALRCAHSRKILHFDVKPSNIMVRDSGTAVLIDFGVSKHYDEGGHVTSSTPVGISKGYAPMEQYRQEDISTFTPATDIYALGATLYTLLTGEVPPDAASLYEEDAKLTIPDWILKPTREAIEKAMQLRRKDRPQSVAAFLSLLDKKPEPAPIPVDTPSSGSEETVIVGLVSPKSEPKPEPIPKPEPKPEPRPKIKSDPAPKPESKPDPNPKPEPAPRKKSKKGLVVGLISAVVVAALIIGLNNRGGNEPVPVPDTPVSVTSQPFTNPVLGDYLYTGPVDSDGQPDGEGKAVFVKKKDQEALSYAGPFVHGVMKGSGVVFTFITGDTFKGSFGEDNRFLEGVLTKKDSGEYFQGTFKDGAPLNGVWYDKNGKKLQDVKNGK